MIGLAATVINNFLLVIKALTFVALTFAAWKKRTGRTINYF